MRARHLSSIPAYAYGIAPYPLQHPYADGCMLQRISFLNSRFNLKFPMKRKWEASRTAAQVYVKVHAQRKRRSFPFAARGNFKVK
jgi:hypothetical protein